MRTGRILVTGGAGFVGSHIAIGLAERESHSQVMAFDDLSRPGSERNVARLERAGVTFVRGDLHEKGELLAIDRIDALVECSAESSSLMSVYHCLELVRRDNAQIVFLSTSRVYPLRHLLAIELEETDTRFEIASEQKLPGVSPAGISEEFPLWGVRTQSGAGRLAGEHLIGDYVEGYGVRGVINRFGVIAGPWSAGVFARWVAAHYFKQPLAYTGFGGSGKQVRDVVHVDDVVELVAAQLAFPDEWSGHVANAGGGRNVSLSLRETTELCSQITGNRLDLSRSSAELPDEVPIYISDCSLLFERSDWRPTRDARAILTDIFEWIRANETEARAAL
ncbi:MAG: CDP-paratose 2-epimerase [Thermoleophilaceae bacterium]|nr:CDP-paratose 2-epimerase [Thermoleophilaceae bacterium]